MGVTPSTAHCPPWLTASSELSLWSHSKSLPLSLMSKGTPADDASLPIPLCSATSGPFFPSYSISCGAGKSPTPIHQPVIAPAPQALAFLLSEGNKSNERNDRAICSRSFSPALARQFVSLTLSDTIPWAAAGKPSNLGAFSIPYGLSLAQGAVQGSCKLRRKHQDAFFLFEGQSKG